MRRLTHIASLQHGPKRVHHLLLVRHVIHRAWATANEHSVSDQSTSQPHTHKHTQTRRLRAQNGTTSATPRVHLPHVCSEELSKSAFGASRDWHARDATDARKRHPKNHKRNYFSTHGAVAGLIATERFLVPLAEKRAADMAPSLPRAFYLCASRDQNKRASCLARFQVTVSRGRICQRVFGGRVDVHQLAPDGIEKVSRRLV